MKYRHYAPGARVTIVLPQEGQSIEEAFLAMLDKAGQATGLFLSEATWEAIRAKLPGIKVYTYQGERDLVSAMRSLFDALRTLDQLGVSEIMAEGFSGEEASAYMDRLTRASSGEGCRRVLFVCEGNTCRSPMAEAIFNDRFEDREARARSAGLSVIAGQVLAEEAAEALREWGIEAGSRPSRQIRTRGVRDADLIVSMTKSQKARLKLLFPEAEDRIFAMADFLDGQDVGDPFGQAIHAYRRVRDQLGTAMQGILDRLILI